MRNDVALGGLESEIGGRSRVTADEDDASQDGDESGEQNQYQQSLHSSNYSRGYAHYGPTGWALAMAPIGRLGSITPWPAVLSVGHKGGYSSQNRVFPVRGPPT